MNDNTEASHKRTPAETRQSLLDSAAKIILEKGLSTLTLERVAKEANVSKGGLLHHFSSKQKLIDALVENLFEGFKARWQAFADKDTVESGKSVRAYLKTVLVERDESAAKLCNILSLEHRDNESMKNLWKGFLSSLLNAKSAGGADPINLAIVQLAIDGLWLAEMEGLLVNSPQLYKKIVKRLEAMTYNEST